MTNQFLQSLNQLKPCPPPPTAQLPPTPKAYPPRPTWENRRVPQHFVIASSPPNSTNSLDLHVGLKTTDTGAKFHMHALVDSGATGSFIDRKFIVKNQIDTQWLSHPVPVLNINGTPNRAGQVAEVVDLILQYQRHAERMLFVVTSLGKRDVILGYPWFRQHNQEVNWQTQEVKLSCCPNCCTETSGRTHQGPRVRPSPENPQTPPQPPNYPDPDEGTSDDEDDGEEASGGELSEIGGCSDRVEEGDRILVTTYMPPETVSATSTISQQIAEESAKDNPKQEKSLHNMIPPLLLGPHGHLREEILRLPT